MWVLPLVGLGGVPVAPDNQFRIAVAVEISRPRTGTVGYGELLHPVGRITLRTAAEHQRPPGGDQRYGQFQPAVPVEIDGENPACLTVITCGDDLFRFGETGFGTSEKPQARHRSLTEMMSR